MNYTKILKRSWHILWHYPALWVFGFLLAFFGGSGNGSNPSNGFQYSFDKNDFQGWNGFQPGNNGSWNMWLEKINRYIDAHFGAINEQTIWMLAIIAALIIFFLVILGTVLNYVAKTAHIRMVNHLEENGEKVSWRKGFKWGWSVSAFRLWLMDLLVVLPIIFVFIVLFGCAALPVLLGITAGEATTAAGVVAAIGIVLVVMLLAFIVGLVVNLWMKIAHRVCVIEGKGVIESLKTGWQDVRKNLQDTFLMWLILVAVQIGFGIVMIPIGLILVALSVGIIGGLGLLVYSVSSNVSIGLIILGIVLLILFLAIPISLVRGLGESYFESVWTLFYREIKTPLKAIIEAPVTE
jgi:hypothetical protein